MAPMKIPEDEELRNIIDKLANFVGRNGPKFEELTKSKQKDNDKFSFLFGGDYHEYYKWKVSLETTQVQAQKQQQVNTEESSNNKISPNEGPKKPDFDLIEFKELLQKLVLACTKDNIQNGKNWIVNNAKTDSQLKSSIRVFLWRILEESLPFQQKLHIVYLANDILHHSRKKDLPQLQTALEHYVLPIIALAYNGETEENQGKLLKVLKIWETQKFFNDDIREKLKNINSLYDSQLDIIDQEKTEIQVIQEKEAKLEQERKQKVEEEERKKAEEQLQKQQGFDQHAPPPPQGFQQPQEAFTQYNYNQWNRPPPPAAQPDPYHFYGSQYPQRQPPPFEQVRPAGFPPYQTEQGPPPGQPGFQQYQAPPPHVQTFDYSHQSVPAREQSGGGPVTFDYEHGRAPLPDGVPPILEDRDPTIPVAPYYDLPAGLMVPLVKLWDCEYRPVDSKELRLPIPQPPSERLLAAIEAFYSPPSHDRPRDAQGWEKNGLYEFFKAKLKYMKDKERILETIERSPSPPPSRSSTPELDGSELVTDGPPPSNTSMSRSPSRSPPPKGRSRSRSRSIERNRERKRSYSRSRSRSKSNSRSPRKKRSRSRSYSRSKSRSPQPRSPVRRSPTPPDAFFTGFVETRSMESRIEESNVGHQLLKKMGWGGQGLGKKESGILDPIKGGEVRDRQDKFKGVGTEMNDPFENFRKNKSYTYGKPRERRR